MSRVTVYPDVCPTGWQRVGVCYRRQDGFLLRELPASPAVSRDVWGQIELFVVAPGDWLLLARRAPEQRDALWFEAQLIHRAQSALVGERPGPNEFDYWMRFVNEAIPLGEVP